MKIWNLYRNCFNVTIKKIEKDVNWWAHTHTYTHTHTHTQNTHTHTHSERERDRQTVRRKDGWMDRQTDRDHA